MFQSKLFRRMFCTYLVMIFACLVIFTSFIVYEKLTLNREQIYRKSELVLAETSSLVNSRLSNAQTIVRNVGYSEAMKQLYMSSKLKTSLEPAVQNSIQAELRNSSSIGGLSIYSTMIFINDSDTAYSSGGRIMLDKSFERPNVVYPHFEVGNVNELFGLSSKRVTFSNEYLIYLDDYTYMNGNKIGTVCILFDQKNIMQSISDTLDEGYGIELIYDDEVILSAGDCQGKEIFCDSEINPNLKYKLFITSNIKNEGDIIFYIIIALTVLFSLIFVMVAYLVSKKYYEPIDHLGQMVVADGAGGNDEMNRIISGIEQLIGEKNVYHDKMLTIAPYAQSGMLHSVIMGNVGSDAVRVISDESYLDLKKPFFIVSIIDFYYENPNKAIEEAHIKVINELLYNVTETYSNEEVRIVYCMSDMHKVFLIVNFEGELDTDELFFGIHKHLSAAQEKLHCKVTMGVDIVRDDINELRQACEAADRALDGIIADGRGEVYFISEQSFGASEYYFPVNFKDRLARCLKNRDRNEVHMILFDIYKKNLDKVCTPKVYRRMLDEFYLITTKTIKEITELSSVHLSLEKYTNRATLQDIFDYYDAALLSIIDQLEENEGLAEADTKLEDDIVTYIETFYCDPNLSQQQIADHFRVSNKYISILCKSRFDTTYLSYIQNKRIEKAKELLKENRYSLTEICTMCGYVNQLTFRRNFKSITGMNPSDYQGNA